MKRILKIVIAASLVIIFFASVLYVQKIDCEHFIEEISALNKQKEFSISFWEIFNPYLGRKIVELRKSYDSAYIEIFKKYNISTDDINERLDEIWNEYKFYPLLAWIIYPLLWSKLRWEYYKENALEFAKQKCKSKGEIIYDDMSRIKNIMMEGFKSVSDNL